MSTGDNTNTAVIWFPGEAKGHKSGGQIVDPPIAATGAATGTAFEDYDADGPIDLMAGVDGSASLTGGDGAAGNPGGDTYLAAGTGDDGGGQSGAQIIARGGSDSPNDNYANIEIIAGDILVSLDGSPTQISLINRPGDELAYAQATAILSITATTEAAGNTFVTAPAITTDGSTAIVIEFYSPFIRVGANGLTFVSLFQDGSSLGQLYLAGGGSIGDHYAGSALARRKITPAAGAHTYSIRGYRSAANGEIGAGLGTSADYQPGYIRITRA